MAAWIIGLLTMVFLVVAYFITPADGGHHPTIRLLGATMAGFFGYLFAGTTSLVAEGTLPKLGKTAVQAGGGTALFLLVFFGWSEATHASQPIRPIHEAPAVGGLRYVPLKGLFGVFENESGQRVVRSICAPTPELIGLSLMGKFPDQYDDFGMQPAAEAPRILFGLTNLSNTDLLVTGAYVEVLHHQPLPKFVGLITFLGSEQAHGLSVVFGPESERSDARFARGSGFPMLTPGDQDVFSLALLPLQEGSYDLRISATYSVGGVEGIVAIGMLREFLVMESGPSGSLGDSIEEYAAIARNASQRLDSSVFPSFTPISD